MNVYDGVFFITVITIITGSIALALKYCLKSKCETFKCCFGAFEIQRNIDAELQEEMKEMEFGVNDHNGNNTNLNTI